MNKKKIINPVITFFVLVLLLQVFTSQGVVDRIYQIIRGAGLLFKGMPQIGIFLLVYLVLFIAVFLDVFRLIAPNRERKKKIHRHLGLVESLAQDITYSEKTGYFRWMLANRLGKIARRMIEMKTTGAVLPSKKLEADFWNPKPHIQKFLESGLKSPFLGRPPGFRKKTPKPDYDVKIDFDEIINYLEEVEKKY